MRNNDCVTELPEDVFRNISFQFITLFDVSNLRIIHRTAILSSKHRLNKMWIINSAIDDFPWVILPELTDLKELHLNGNFLTVLPTLSSDTLVYLSLQRNRISTLELEWNIPNLEVLDLDENPIGDFPTGFFVSFEKLNTFDCASCDLGPTLRSGSLEFQTQALKSLFLIANNISTVEPGAITGVTNKTNVYLRDNLIAKLTEETFRPILEVVSRGDGKLYLENNPVVCGCRMEWYALNSDFNEKLLGNCTDGTDFESLTANFFRDCLFLVAATPPSSSSFQKRF
ncbi:unnamed protein product [Darwinula stevensoni]|uniref:Uncharacterized protein n=1 Tax=Darwinula stevensoni TaxID=69355 RepID=A0A7R8X403_9CRUS|nr:unnamed protein product [Darwinula stevensoni]CAG0885522.1 unnamed protein product [Darwinula stevensoni]